MKFTARIASRHEPYWWLKDNNGHKTVEVFSIEVVHHVSGEQIAFKFVVLMFMFAVSWTKRNKKPQTG